MTGLGSQKPPKMSSKWVQNGSKINKKNAIQKHSYFSLIFDTKNN